MSVAVQPHPSCHSETDRAVSVDLDAWYRRYGESVYRRCLRLCGEPSRAADLLQEVFLRAHRFKHTYRGEAKPLGWLYTIANRCFVDSLRKKPPIDDETLRAFLATDSSSHQDDSALDNNRLVAALLARVPADIRDIVTFRYFDELELDEIATRLGINERTVRRKLQRFEKSARKLLVRTCEQ